MLETRSYVYRRLGEWPRALAEMERAIELDPRNVFRLSNHALTHLALRDYASAERLVEAALEVQPDAAEPYWRRALIPMLRDGDVTRLERAVADAPAGLDEFGVTMNDRRTWLAALYRRDYAGARRVAEALKDDALELQNAYMHRSALLGLTYELEGQPDLAAQHYDVARTRTERALQGNPDDERLHIAHGEALASLGERDGALRAADRALEILSPSSDALIGRSNQQEVILRVLLPAGAHDRALDMLDDYLSAPGGIWTIEGLLPDPRLDPIRDDPRFLALVETHGRK